MSEEIELKLAMTPRDLRRLSRNGFLRGLKTGRARRTILDSTYFDTPGLVMWRHGMSLRLRRDGARCVQTLKAPPLADGRTTTDAHATLARRVREYEAEVNGEAPDLSLIDDAELQAFFSREGIARDLEPVFSTGVERRLMPLALADCEIELALDEGRIVSGGETLEVCEAELELRTGKPARLYELAMLLHRQVPFRLERESKAHRGYRLYTGEAPRPSKAEKPLLAPGSSVAEAFRCHARACLRQMRANEEPVLDGSDPEGVHQMRVAIRRLRALVTAFHPVFAAEPYTMLRDELRWMQGQLGQARDWDVFLHETLAPLRARLPLADSLECLRQASEMLRAEAYETARAAVRSERYTDLLLRLELWLEDGGWCQAPDAAQSDPGQAPVEPLARAILVKRARKMRKLGKRHHELSEAELHALRIAAKKLRYAGEFFAGLYPKKAVKKYQRQLEALQDRLGIVNDAATGQRLLEELDQRLRQGGETDAATIAHGKGVVHGWQEAHMQRELAVFAEAWEAFRQARPFWR